MIGFTFGGHAGGQGPQLFGGQHMDGHGLQAGGQHTDGQGLQGSHEGIGQQLGSQEISQHIIGGQHGSHISEKEGNRTLIKSRFSVPSSVPTLAFLGS